ncbi:MAG: hypothetical protein J5626_05900 [Lachnospiraceae bacterium]|nr:hypothetical protein [Lachnospiraceae bacterium]
MVGINGLSKGNQHLDAVNTARAKRTAGVKAKDGEGKLSKKAADFLAKLREERADFDFEVSDGKDLNRFAGKSDKEYSVYFSAEELEKMADDPQYAEEKLHSLDTIVEMSDKIGKDEGFASILGENSESEFWADAISFSVSDKGEIKIFADIKKTPEVKQEKPDKADDKADKKSFKEQDITKAHKKDKIADIKKIEALTVEDFLDQLKNIA